MSEFRPTTGLPSLDRVFEGLRPGDNVVWQVDAVEDYAAFVEPFVRAALAAGVPVVYYRFARHRELVAEGPGVRVVRLKASAGFESFITTIRNVIAETGPHTCHVFDTLSELARDTFGDRMLGNFFKVTCPYLFDLDTITYFALNRTHHSFHATGAISETTQLLVDVYRHRRTLYVHPLKVEGRFSPVIFNLHAWKDDDFVLVRESAVISDVLSSAPWPGLPSASYRLVGQRDRRFMQAEEVLAAARRKVVPERLVDVAFRRLLPQILSDDAPIRSLARRFFTLEDLLHIWRRMIGGGRIGGKSIGMLLARAILRRSDKRWKDLLEAHNSFYIGSDVFYTFLIENQCWAIRQKQKSPETFLDDIEEARRRILEGEFPDYIVRRFTDMLDYFGQAPIIVRSSSLLEDNFGNAFAGKYESVFCANQGDRKERLEAFLDAVRLIYASTMSEEALVYRMRRGVLDQDEQMALLVQRVSGRPYGRRFFPHLAGVAFSFNPYVWNEGIDPHAGMMRLVFGLGTRAVDRADDDYTRVVALNDPERRPEANFDQVKKYSQRRADVIDLDANRMASAYFVDITADPGSDELPVDLFATLDEELEEAARQSGRPSRLHPWVLTFDRLFRETRFLDDIRALLAALRDAYGREVDVEFTANFLDDGSYTLNLLQCRPLQVRIAALPGARTIPRAAEGRSILRAHGAVIGPSRIMPVDRIVYVVPGAYGHLPEQDRYAVARLIGRIAHAEPGKTLVLVGPGRWGTHMPSLGVPVSFSEINTVSALCEIDTMHEGLVPDLSLGTHFFNEMVEQDMLYIAFFKSKTGNELDEAALTGARNRLVEILPGEERWESVVRVLDSRTRDAADPEGAESFYLDADAIRQAAVLYRAAPSRPARGRSS